MPDDRTAVDARRARAAALFKALGHPTRVAALELLSEHDELSPIEIADHLRCSSANVAYHVSALAKGGLVYLRGTTAVRGAIKHHYRLTDTGHLALQLAAAAVDGGEA